MCIRMQTKTHHPQIPKPQSHIAGGDRAAAVDSASAILPDPADGGLSRLCELLLVVVRALCASVGAGEIPRASENRNVCVLLLLCL
jgi:hypothetical protein